MVSKSGGLWVTTIFILLSIQGIYGKSFFGQMVNDEGEHAITDPHSEDKLHKDPLPTTLDLAARRPEITGNYSSVSEAIWYERMKTPWFGSIVKNASYKESHHHHDAELTDVSLAIKTFAAGHSQGFAGDTWNDRMKKVLVGITGAIPPVGGVPIGKIISSLLNAFWPESEKDIWSLIKDQVEGLIDQKILEFELQERSNEISAIQTTMQMYVDAQEREKGSFMSTLIHACNELYIKLTKSSNSVQLIPLVVTHSTQHLLILKERLLHGKEMYSEDNTPIWRRDLEKQISSYKDYIKDIYSKWVEWRKSKIIVDVGAPKRFIPTPPFFTWEPYGKVNDEMTGDTASYRYNAILGPDSPNFFRSICEAVKQNMFGSRNGELLQILVTTFYLNNFMPGNEDNPSVIPPSMSIASFGPMSPYIGGGSENSYLYSPGDDNTGGGDVTKINVREWNIIDGFQVFYSTGSGSFYGNSGGGQLHEFPLNNRRVKSIQFCENNCNQVELTIGFSNGDSSGRLGNRGGWHVGCANTGGIDTYGLYNIRATGSGCARGLFQIGLDYKAYPVRPSEINK